jgi:hypothetical protein
MEKRKIPYPYWESNPGEENTGPKREGVRR